MSAGVGTGAGIGLNSNTWSIGEEMFKNDYYVYVLEQIGGDFLRGRIDGEWWLNDASRRFNLWNNLFPYAPRPGSKSFYGTADSGWLAFETGTNTSEWWGGGMYVYGPPLNYTNIINSVLHMGFRANGSYETNTTFTVGVGGGGDSQSTFTVGSIGSGADFEFARGTSEGQSIEVPFSFLFSRGMPIQGTMVNQNYLTFGSDTGAYEFSLEVDAVYWYNPNSPMI